MTKKKKKNIKFYICNVVHGVIILVIFLCVFYAIILETGFREGDSGIDFKEIILHVGINEIFIFIGAISFVLFGINGIYEFAYLNGIHCIVPPVYIFYKEKNLKKQAKMMMSIYYRKNIDFIHEYEKERIDYILQALQIDENQFHHIKYELIKMRAMPINERKQLIEKTEKIVYDPRFIIDQSSIPLCDRIYKDVDYFINLYTALYDSELCVEIGRIMANFIVMCMEESIKDLNYILIPKGSNLLLGLEVGKILRKPIIAMQEKERILRNEFWDGVYQDSSYQKNQIIIIHDVLVTGKRIYESVEMLPKNTYNIKGLFCIIKYENSQYDPEKNLKEHDISNINYIVRTDENILRKKIKK